MSRILILYADAGYGHRKIAESIAEEFRARKLENVSIDIKDALEFTPPSFKKSYPKLYFWMVSKASWLWGFSFYFTDLPWILPIMRPARALWNSIQSAKLRKYLRDNQFDFLIFTHFFAAEVAANMKRKGQLKSTLITVVTDVIPHAVWQNRGTDIYWVMAPESKNALLNRDPKLEHIIEKGIPIGSIFLKNENTSELQGQLGLKPNRKTLLFTSGSFGIGPTEKILELLGTWKEQIQVIVVCGNNKTLYELLNKKRFGFPVTLLGFTNKMHELMSVSDLMIAKPGGATMCESLSKGVPMLIMSPIPGQETFNAKWLIANGAALELKKPQDILKVIPNILNGDGLLERMKQGTERIKKPNAAKDFVDFVLSYRKP